MRLCFYQEWKLENRSINTSPVEYDLSYILLLTFGGLCQQGIQGISISYISENFFFRFCKK